MTRKALTLLPLAGLLVFALAGTPAVAQNETIVVTTLEDRTDFAGSQQVANLPGPDGVVSFREACTAANNTAGPQTIHFAIPQSEWWLYADRALLRLEDGAYVLSDDETTVDFQTQTAVTGDTNPDGWEVGIYGLEANAWGVAAIYIFGDRCTIRGLDRVLQRGYAVEILGHDNRVVGCTISGPFYSAVRIWGGFNGTPPTGNVIGGTDPADSNRLDGIRIEGPADRNLVTGNEIDGGGIGVVGSMRYGQVAYDNVVRFNSVHGVGYYGEEGFPVGIHIGVVDAVGTLVESNLVGIQPDGVTPGRQTGPTGISVAGAQGTIVRGNVVGAMRTVGVNHYAGQVFGTGIAIGDEASGTTVVGNLVGTDVTGTRPIPNLYGIVVGSISYLTPPGDVIIGGPGAGQGNLVAFNERAGVSVREPAVSATISGNSIHSNGELGIDLVSGTAGVTPNDPGDGDTGANGLQNFPVLLDALAFGRSTRVVGTLNSRPKRTYTIEVFANSVCDPSGHGEGERFLGSTTVVTDAAGNASFVAVVDGETFPGEQVTATATDADGSTSEFAACIAARGRTVSSNTPPVLTK